MMILAPGCLNNSLPRRINLRSRGYSLLELLIVLVVIGTLTSIATLSVSSFSVDPAEKALTKLRFNVELLSNEAIIRAEPLGLGFFDQGYVFFRLRTEDNEDDGFSSERAVSQWAAIENDSLLKAQEFPKTFKQQVQTRDVAFLLSGKAALEPQIYAMPTGEITPFTYQLKNTEDGNDWVLKFDALGRVIKPDEKATATDLAGES